jgi:CubicO group peptidase (beta-lactamase class C family)
MRQPTTKWTRCRAKLLTGLALFCFCVSGVTTNAQTDKRLGLRREVVKGEVALKLDELLSRYAGYGFSGTVLAAKDGQIILNKGYGLADRERNISNAANTAFDIASITKTFTAAAILHLETRGKLKTGDPISKYLGEVPTDKANVTIHHLLTHTAGFKLDAGDAGITASTGREEFLQKAKDAPLLSPPGEKYSYSNLGYALLAIIIEKVSGQSWQSYLRKFLMKPAGMSHSAFYENVSWNDSSVARGYTGSSEETLKLEESIRQDLPGSYMWKKHPIGAVGIVSTTGDLFKWWLALQSDRIFPESTRKKMFTLQAGGQGYGWNIQKDDRAVTRISRGGLRGSFQSMLAYYPEENAVLVFGLNKNVNLLWASVGWSNMERVIRGKGYAIPPPVTPVDPSTIQHYAGQYELNSTGRFRIWTDQGALFIGAEGQEAVNILAYPQQPAPAFQREITALSEDAVKWLLDGNLAKVKEAGALSQKNSEDLQRNWESWMNRVGKFQSYKILGSAPGSSGGVRVFVRLVGEKDSVAIRLLWDWDKKNLLAWGDDIPLPAIAKLWRESEMSFVAFDFNTSQAVHLTFSKYPDGTIVGLTVQSKDGRNEVTARKTQ